MTNPVTQVRTDVADTLKAAGIHAFSVAPEKAVPPMVYVGPGDPYLTQEGAYAGNEIVRLQLSVVTAPGVNEVQAEALDALLLKVLDVLWEKDELHVTEVDRPGQIAINGQGHLAVAVFVQTEITRARGVT